MRRFFYFISLIFHYIFFMRLSCRGVKEPQAMIDIRNIVSSLRNNQNKYNKNQEKSKIPLDKSKKRIKIVISTRG